jgi:hypothetical protein
MNKLTSLTTIAMSVALLSVAAIGDVYGQAHFRSQVNGAWTAAGTWLRVSGTDADGIPDADDTVEIAAGTTVTTGGTTSDCATLTVNAGGTLSLNGSGNVRLNGDPASATINGTVILSSSGDLIDRGTPAGTRTLVIGSGGVLTISGTAAFPDFDSYSLDPASTVEFTRNGNQTILSGVIFGNLTIGGSGVKTVGPIPSDTTFISRGTLTVGGTGTRLDVSTAILHLNFEGDVIVQAGDTLDSSVGIVVVVFSGSQFINNGVFLTSYTPGFGYTPTVTYENTTVSGSSPQSYYDLIVNGVMSPGGNVTVTRHVQIMPGGTFDAGTGLTHSVGGNWTNDGTFNAGTSTILITGAGVSGQVVIGATSFYNVVLSAAAGGVLDGNVSMVSGGTFSITRGSLATGSYTLTINNSNPAALSLDTCKITGTVSRAIAASSSQIYRFFGPNSYITPSGSGNPSFVTASVFPNTNPPALAVGADTAKIVKRYMTVSAANPGPGFTYGLRFGYKGSEVRGNQLVYTVWVNPGSGWLNLGTGAQHDTVNHFVEQAGISSFGTVAVAENTAALPIQLVSFTGSVAENSSDVTLTWRTVSEITNYGFTVQRSMKPNEGFVDLPNSFVPGHGTTLVPHSYTWIDAQMAAGTYYYRLKQMDLDGTATVTEAVKVVVAGNVTSVDSNREPVRFALEQNYPNPFNPSTRIRFSVDASAYTSVVVYNVQGVEVATLFSGTATPGVQYEVTFEGKSLSNGMYFCRLTSGNQSALRKMILLK